jgi:hypothetical protein
VIAGTAATMSSAASRSAVPVASVRRVSTTSARRSPYALSKSILLPGRDSRTVGALRFASIKVDGQLLFFASSRKARPNGRARPVACSGSDLKQSPPQSLAHGVARLTAPSLRIQQQVKPIGLAIRATRISTS